MRFISNPSILILISVLIIFSPVKGNGLKPKSDGICPEIRTVLCLKDTLEKVANGAKEVDTIAYRIKQQIKREPTQSNINEYTKHKMDSIRTFLPQSKYHFEYMHVHNNINRTGLLNLIKEQHYAYSYLYNSIRSVLKLGNIFAPSVDKSFKAILLEIEKNILCNYQNIFYTYSEPISSVDEIDGIQVTNRRKRHAPSLMHNSYSMIIVELLNEWMQNVNSFNLILSTTLIVVKPFSSDFYSTAMLLLLNILVLSVVFISAELQSKFDNMCPATRDVLCVKDTLLTIATVARSINRTANEIERTILSKYQEIETLNRYINYEMGVIQVYLPLPRYHVKFFQVNYVDKNFLHDLLLEAHNALSYFYRSIDRMLSMRDISSFTSDLWFGQIADNLRYEMICGYRNVLSVYSHAWPSIDQVNEVQFSRKKYTSPPSMTHDVHAVIIIRLLREWMRKIHETMINMESKYYSMKMNPSM
ncbi:unnamed protein product [Adineta ricciae]|uniref:Uncharacterized protein n=1 Tax=Adineta ricciae TaxID=249248 RepID=A0A814C772_ADIRI|nr:unnamed protein product [Adineta ricciae]CAF1093062.1 unnamed protein product [Adineta ricciae]